MLPADTDQTASPVDQDERKRKLMDRLTYVLMVPVLLIYFFVLHDSVMSGLSSIGVLPKFGIMQFFDGAPKTDWDAGIIGGIAGGCCAMLGNLLARQVAQIVVRQDQDVQTDAVQS